jgi:precorrin-6Y C5,15-methyltransferase (decarboxylating)
MKLVAVIGMGMSPDDLTPRHLDLIRAADILVGGKRLLKHFQNTDVTKKEITKDLKQMVTYIRKRMADQSIVVLASGDPLFYGIGSLLTNKLGADRVVIYPNVSSVSAAFARIKEPWQDAVVISLHGKPAQKALLKAVAENDTVAVLTDPHHHPALLARLVSDSGVAGIRMCVLEQLGTPSEKVGWHTLELAVEETFSEPNIVIFKRIPPVASDRISPYPGMPEDMFEHQRGLITKAEIRAVTLSKLRPAVDHIIWDLGAGSGAVAIEAALFAKKGRVIAVEKISERVEQIKINRKRFGIKNLDVIQAALPEGLTDLPRPDRIFVGGGGRHTDSIIRAAAGFLNSDGIIVVNTVLIQNLERVVDTLQALEFQTNAVQVQINRSRNMPWGQRFEGENPVWIISGVRHRLDNSF